jgi:hypothetical protein
MDAAHTKLLQIAKKRNLVTAGAPAPFYDPERDGVTFSVLSSWTQCKELARLGLHGVTSRATSQALVFGTLVHAVLQFVYEAARHGQLKGVPTKEYVVNAIQMVEAIWRKENPLASEATLKHLEFSLIMAESVLPRYFTYWAKDFSQMRWLGIEHEFRIPITVELANGRKVKTFVRGKMDGNFETAGHLRLFETKTKSRIDEETQADILPTNCKSTSTCGR